VLFRGLGGLQIWLPSACSMAHHLRCLNLSQNSLSQNNRVGLIWFMIGYIKHAWAGKPHLTHPTPTLKPTHLTMQQIWLVRLPLEAWELFVNWGACLPWPAVAGEVWQVHRGDFTSPPSLRVANGFLPCETSRLHLPDLPGQSRPRTGHRGQAPQLKGTSEASQGNLTG
jgi:hypothetical protein